MRIFKKIFKLFSLKFTCKIPDKNDLIIFDNVNSIDFKYVMKDLKYFTLNVRFEEIKKIYISWQIIFLFLRNIFKGIKISYLIAVIKTISPKVIITLQDISFDFSIIAKILHKKYIFIAVQQHSVNFCQYRKLFEKKILKKNPNSLLFLPNYFCFGDQVIKDTKNENIAVKNYFPLGLLRLSNYIQFKKEQNIVIEDLQYDVAIICEKFESKKKLWRSEKLARDYMKTFKYNIKAAINNNLKLVFILKSKKKKRKRK